LKLKYENKLSAFAFNFNLRRYSKEAATSKPLFADVPPSPFPEFKDGPFKVGRCRLTVSKPDLKPRLVSALETKM
jgi:hypothetical protein